MTRTPFSRSWLLPAALAASLVVAVPPDANAQRGRGAGAQPPQQAAPVDMTGYWVSIVTEDWRFRMLAPPKGDYDSLPLNPAGRKVADAWDPAGDEAAGEQCRWYGAASIMSVPGRLHITWEDPRTLRIDTDAGMQTRLLHFGGQAPGDGEPSWQGYSTARWRTSSGGIEPGSQAGGSLEVTTTQLRPGYLRRNGVPYSADTRLTEYYNVLEDAGTTWLIVMTVVEDPMYLTQPFVTSRQFMKQADDAGWNPTPCSAR
jgi:hypothetical protein